MTRKHAVFVKVFVKKKKKKSCHQYEGGGEKN